MKLYAKILSLMVTAVTALTMTAVRADSVTFDESFKSVPTGEKS